MSGVGFVPKPAQSGLEASTPSTPQRDPTRAEVILPRVVRCTDALECLVNRRYGRFYMEPVVSNRKEAGE